jgi:hypothetical protein
MPAFRITAPDGTAYNVTGPEGATEQDALAQVQAQHTPAPAASQTSQTLGFEQGLDTVGDNAAQGAQKIANMVHIPFVPNSGLGDLIDKAGQALGFPSTQGAIQSHADAVNAEAVKGVVPGRLGRFAGDVAGTLPAMALGPVMGGAASGALTADPQSSTSAHVTNAGVGAATGGTLSAVGKAIAPGVSDAVQRLAARGVTMTPGQIFSGNGMGGKIVKGLEDRIAGFPIIGDMITGAKNHSLEDFANGQSNAALGPLDRVGIPSQGPGLVPAGTVPPPVVPNFPTSVPKGMVGHDSVKFAGDTLGSAYDSIIPQTHTALDQPFWQSVTTRAAQAANELPPERAAQMQSTLSGVFNRLGTISPNGATQIPGGMMQGVTTKLGQLSREYSGAADPDMRAMGRVYAGVLDDVKGAVATSNPQLAPQLQAVNEGWANLVPAERAAASASGNASGKLAGVFSPQQLRTAGRQGDNSVRDRATARGEALAQQYAEDGIQVLPSSVGDSGTAGRASLLALPALGAAAMAHPVAAAGLAATPLIYSRPVLQVINALYAHGASPGATMLGKLVRNLGVPAAAAVAGGNG